MRASRFLMVGLFLAGAVAVIEAQQPRQPGGFGGFGRGGLTTQVITNKDLQEELKITDAQKEKLKAAADRQEEMQKKFRDSFKEFGKDRDKAKERFAEMQKENEKATEEVRKMVDDVLTADQKKRLKQIERQVAGVRAFTDEEVAAELNLSDSQKSKVKGIVDDYSKDVRELGGFGGGFGKGGFDKEKAAEAQKKREKLSKSAIADIEDVLNDEQRKKWKEMTGEPFDRSKLQLGGGFGGGFGGGRPPQKQD
jgi:Spy/CpxP family protein refolding chaperone